MTNDTRHSKNISRAHAVMDTLRKIKHQGQKLEYLRKIDPYVFEELVLNALEGAGYRVQRSPRYSGDGGIDGTLSSSAGTIFIQSKRYRGHINAGHVKEFAALCSANDVYGFFVHTGKTGGMSKSSKSKRVDIISGSRLLKLVTRSKLTPRLTLGYKLKCLFSPLTPNKR